MFEELVILHEFVGSVQLWLLCECVNTLTVEGPYAGMNIAGVTGITEAQKAALKGLEAVEEDRVAA